MDLETLVDIELLKQLKARYFRTLDRQEWDAFADLFTDDALMNNTHDEVVVRGRGQIRDYVSSALAGCRSVHHGHMPELSVDRAAGTATGIWAMFDFLDFGPGSARTGIKGYGHYHEEYRREPDGWRISSLTLWRLRVDPYPA